MTTDEKVSDKHNVREHGFPITFVKQAIKASETIYSWEDLLAFIEHRDKGTSELSWLLTWKVKESDRVISLTSLMADEVSIYFALYTEATAKYTHGYLFPGQRGDQPNLLLEAFAEIDNSVKAWEQNSLRLMRRKQADMESKING